MAFGLVQIKWGILQRPLGCNLNNLKWMAQCLARLHNFTVNERLAAKEDPVAEARAQVEGDQATCHPTVPHDKNGNPININRLFTGTHDGCSHLREDMVRRVESLGLERPAGNRMERNSDTLT